MRVDQHASIIQELTKGVSQGVVLDPAALAGLIGANTTGVVDIIGRIAKAEIGFHPVQHFLHIRGHCAVAAEQPVLTEDPDIAEPCY